MFLLLAELALRSITPPFYSFGYLEKICKRKLIRNPLDKDVLWFLGNLYIWYEKYSDARPYLESLMKILRDTRNVRLLLGKVYYNLDLFEEVIDVMSGREVLFDGDMENFYLGDSLLRKGRFAEAIRPLELYVNHFKNNFVPFARLGCAYLFIHEYQQALNAFRKAEALSSGSQEVQDSIAHCIERLNEQNSLIPERDEGSS